MSNDPTFCPKCQSEDVQSDVFLSGFGDVELGEDKNLLYLHMECLDCRHKYDLKYAFESVESP